MPYLCAMLIKRPGGFPEPNKFQSMKTDVNGVSQCQKGCENYETFTHRRKKFYQYEYRAEDGELFTCVKPTLSECRKARDEHFKPVTVVYTPAEFKEKGFDGEIAKYMREHTNTAIVGDVPGVDRHVIRYRTHKDWMNYKNPYSTK